MAGAIVQFLLSAAVIAVAGSALTRYADAIADLTGLGRLLVGSIFLAVATSLPELSVDVSAVRMGAADIAVGDLLGSSLFNLLILALLDSTYVPRWRLLSPVSAAHALPATQSIALTALAGIGILLGPRLAGVTLGGVGPAVLAILLAYVLGVRMVFLDQKIAAAQKEEDGGDAAIVVVPAGAMTLKRAVLGYLIAAGAILAAGPFLAVAASRIAALSGMGNSFVGTTFVAICTSLPELVATLAAVRMGAPDLALGNIFGSNVFNMVLLVPLDLIHPGSLLSSVASIHVLTCLATILATTVAIMGQLYRAERRIHFIEPDALLVVVLVVGALAMIYNFGG
ncbi:sodium:calcium antiporter [Singulisphaera sp. Ch08]|uniref:Sodium:calcium antiporter n=1 Tax=Singulisphaera sp. Ch08 TaxID=3120278 RepID=A0AAU7CAX3_9BACT